MKNCKYCHRPNNDTATYCKWCGQLIKTEAAAVPTESIGSTTINVPQRGLDMLVEKDRIVEQLKKILEQTRSLDQNFKRSHIDGRMRLSFVITGESGTGKNVIAQAIAQELYDASILSSDIPKVIKPQDYDSFTQNLEDNIKNLGNRVLVIDDADKLVRDGQAIDVQQIDYIIRYLPEWSPKRDKPVVIFLGNQRLADYFSNNPNSQATVNFFLKTEPVTTDGLMEITRRELARIGLMLSDAAQAKLRRIYMNDQRHPADSLGDNGHDANKRAYSIQLNCTDWSRPVPAEAVEGKEFKVKTFEEVMKDFNRFVGVDEVIREIRSIANKAEQKRQAEGPDAKVKVQSHYLFIGNPGTGKTTMARLFADALRALGVLSTGQLVEVSRRDLVAQYVGQTAAMVAKCFDKAMGGVLFIDEAYSLKKNDQDSYGQEAIDTLIQEAENRRGNVVVIMAGYRKEMNQLMDANSGLKRRFDTTIFFHDYTGPELTKIFRGMVANSEEHYVLSEEADRQIDKFFDKMYLMRTANFGNAGEVRNVFENAVKRLADRIEEDKKKGIDTNGRDRVITMDDIMGESGKVSLEQALAKLDKMVGMEGVKKQLRSIANRVQQDRRKIQHGGKATLPKIHVVITGNPGTGKTVVARCLGDIFKAIGVLPKGHLVQRERRTLLDSFANSAAINMDKAVDEAMEGVLFIDEAYNLIPMDGTGQKDKSGTEAVEALMTRMENDAGKFVCVMAGYKAEMEEFIANANPGLARRFTHRIHIDDYSVNDLVEIFKINARAANDNGGYKLTPEAEQLLYKKIEEMVTMKDKKFGNAGTIVNLFNETIERQSDRLAELGDEESDEQLWTIEASDIPYEAPKKVNVAECMRELDKLVGLDGVKKAVKELADTLVIQQERAKINDDRTQIKLDHYLFLGNPGTGKTTVARIMGNIFYSLGLLPSNKVVEVTPKDLIAPYVGQTGPRTAQVIDRAVGGILFIDEAYGLNDGPNGFGKDAMPVLLTKLLDYKNRMVCIAAGYNREMQQWMDTNTGCTSRFTAQIQFDDYSADELAQIFLSIADKEKIHLDEDAKKLMHSHFESMVENKGVNFANAREAGNYFDRVKLRQGARLRRLIDSPDFDRGELNIFRGADMEA